MSFEKPKGYQPDRKKKMTAKEYLFRYRRRGLRAQGKHLER